MNDAGTEIVGMSLPADIGLELGVALVKESHDKIRRERRGTADYRSHVRSRPVPVPAAPEPDSEPPATEVIDKQEVKPKTGERGTFAWNPVADLINNPIVPCPGPESCDVASGAVGNWESHFHLADGQVVRGKPPVDQEPQPLPVEESAASH